MDALDKEYGHDKELSDGDEVNMIYPIGYLSNFSFISNIKNLWFFTLTANLER